MLALMSCYVKVDGSAVQGKTESDNADRFKGTGIIALSAAFAKFRGTRHGKFGRRLLLEHFLGTCRGSSADTIAAALVRLAFLMVD